MLRLSRLVVIAVGLLSTSLGCMRHPRLEIDNVPIPIVLGERLHIGADPSFGRSEMLERILIEDLEFHVWEDNDSAHNATQIAAALAERDQRHAARNLGVRGSAFAVWFILPAGFGEELTARGEVIGIIPSNESEGERDQ